MNDSAGTGLVPYQAKLCPGIVAYLMDTASLFYVPATPLQIHSLADAIGKAEEDGSNDWDPDILMEDPSEALGF